MIVTLIAPMKEFENIETERTFMRKLTIADAVDFYNLNLNEEVLRYTGDQAFESIQAAVDFLADYDQYEKYGVGRLAVIDKVTLKFIGWCGLKYCPNKNEYDIGFRFFKHTWNKGYATETASACLQYGINELGLNKIVGRAMKANAASIKVLEKIGMTFKADLDFDGQSGVLYEMIHDK